MSKMCVVRFRHIRPEDMMTPLMYLPIQQTHMVVDAPYGIEQARTAVSRELELNPSHIHDIECAVGADWMQPKPSPKRKGMSNAQFNNRYVRTKKGYKAEIANASEDSLRGTAAGRTNKVAVPQ